MNSTPECVTKTPEIESRKKEAREKLAAIFSDAEQRDNSKVNPELGKTAIDIKMDFADNGAVDFCNQALGSYGKSLDYINNSPLETVQAIGNSLQRLREYKTKEICE
ncbi:hypothetical protein LRM44_03610 [Candidatus Nanosynbacter sp. HMT-352]|uniref:hypothetical protein n=1 Tax=Candidatus Nanosynbacter sp. HMT-352 TaxID=2899133 RepID=UPI001FB68587|nr:hypothetical protein [Candidatus Nanosynbacter sp. HMT-352]UOG66354.1 hypothetical protein LRM44_03610 [Candidatus Nanosynbacter sp. HMT-352]